MANSLKNIGIGMVALASVTASAQVLSAGLHDTQRFPGEYKVYLLGKKIFTSGFQLYTRATSPNPNAFTVYTSLYTNASAGGRRGSAEIVTSGYEYGPSGRYVSGKVRVNGRTVYSRSQHGTGSSNADINNIGAAPISKEIGRGKISVSLPVVGSVGVSVGLDALIRPNFAIVAATDTTNAFLRTIRRNGVSIEADASAGGSALGFGAGVKGSARFIKIDTGNRPPDTKITLKRNRHGNNYYNRVNLNVCGLGGKLYVWGKAFGIKRTKNIINRRSRCSSRTLVDINRPISYRPGVFKGELAR